MVDRRPLVLVSGKREELPAGDTIAPTAINLEGQYAEDNTVRSTTSNAPIPAQTYVATGLLGGNYKITTQAIYSIGRTNQRGFIDMVIGGITERRIEIEPKDRRNDMDFNQFVVRNLPAGDTTIEIQFFTSNGSTTITIFNSSITIQRFV